MIILGINSAYHESAAAILVDGKLVFFIEEERINRMKHGKVALIDNPHVLPEGSIAACLKSVGCGLDDVDLIGYSFAKEGRLQNINVEKHLEPDGWGTEAGERLFHECLEKVPAGLAKFGKKSLAGRFQWIPHHTAHAASAFLCSPYEKALVLAIDGIGEFDSLLMANGADNELKPLLGLPYPQSLGLLWEKICKYLGFTEYDACKVMGLASYGDPERFRKEFSNLAWLNDDGTFSLDLDVARFRSGDKAPLERLFGESRHHGHAEASLSGRTSGSLPSLDDGNEIKQHHYDVAAILQRFTEDSLLRLCEKGKKMTGAEYLCLSGGVALNCLANSRLEREGGFKGVFIQPAANDAGTALGACLHIHADLPKSDRESHLEHAYWGIGYSSLEVEATLERKGLGYRRIENPAIEAAHCVAAGKIVGWFQGRMEMGPRALGNRSLLADPRRGDMREILNRKIKHRETFRPFAPSVLAEHASDWFDMPGLSPSTDFMLLAYPTKPGRAEKIPAVIHVDRTSRIQTVKKSVNPLYHSLISEFGKLTGVPMVLNTSFNDSEPIVMSPENAIATFLKTGIDVLFMDRYMVVKS